MKIHPLKLIRIERGIKQIDLANQMGITEQRISCWETYRTKPYKKELIELAKILKVEPEELFPDSGYIF